MSLKVIIFTFLLLPLIGFSQETVVTAGGDVESSDGFISYSIGQVFYVTIEDESYSVAQGIQHAYDVEVLSSVEVNIEIDLVVYPNPTTDVLNLKIESPNDQSISYQLVDLQGKLILNDVVTEETTQLNMTTLETSSYILNVIQKGQLIKSFRIVKH